MMAATRRPAPLAPDPTSPRQDAMQMATLVRDCQTAGIARRACAVRLSRVAKDRLPPHHLRLARAALEPLAHADRARLFILPTRDIVAIWRGPAETALTTTRTAIMHLFAEDESFPDAAGHLWEEFDLPQDAERLLALAQGPADQERRVSPPPHGTPPLDPAALSALEAQLARADVAHFARRHQICAALPDGRFRLRWEKRTLCIDELAACLSPNHDPQADPWLFRRLTRTLDRRMLALLAAPAELQEAGPFAINLNVASILAPEFLRFDAALPAALRGHVTLDLQPADILADPASFLFACDFARARDYRLLLHGVTAASLALLPLPRLGLDLLRLRWSDDLARLDPALVQAEAPRIVLSHADTPAVVAWGVAQGIGLFQGRGVVEPPRHARPGDA